MTPLTAPRLELPQDDIWAAAARYLASLAYPDINTVGAEKQSAAFVQALLRYRVHHTFKHQDRAAALKLCAPGETGRIRRREFQTCLDRGLAGIIRSLLVLHLYERRQSRAIQTFQGRGAADINAAMPSWAGVMRGYAERWKVVLALNETGPGGRNEKETLRRLRKRALSTCSAVLPLAHGLATCADEPLDDTTEAIGERLLEIFLEPEPWLSYAVFRAQLHRQHPYPRGGEPELHPSCQVEVVWTSVDGGVVEPDVAPLRNVPTQKFGRPWRGNPEPREVAV